jgi:glycosyltransferase involved in cell wall biosynthesis
MSAASPLVSVIVPVRDNATGVRALIRRLEEQTLARDRFEVVIGDDGSRDTLVGVATEDGWIRVSPGPPHTSYIARNRAARAARGAILAFCDSDCLPEPDWLERGLAALDAAQLVAGEVRFVPPARLTAWSLLTADMFFDQERSVRWSVAVTANLFVSRTVFERLGGFDESFPSPSNCDYDFVRRAVGAGAQLVHEPRAVVLHPTIDDGRNLLGKVWSTNRWAAARRARERAQLSPLFLLEFLVPLVGPAIVRRRAGLPLARLDLRRLAAAEVGIDRRRRAAALALRYLVVPFVAGVARVAGWFTGRGP